MFFRGLLNKIKKRRPMLANRMGGFLRQRPQLMERMRNLRDMRGMGRNMMMPGMGIGSLPIMRDMLARRRPEGFNPNDRIGNYDLERENILGGGPSNNPIMSNDSDRFKRAGLKVRQLQSQNDGTYDPGNNLPTQTPGRMSDIMPRDGMMPKQPPQLGLANQMPGVPPRGSGLPPMPNPMMGINMGMPNYMSSGQPPKMVLGMNGGGEAKYPNAGLAALAKEAPEVVERMGYQEGGVVPGIDMPSSNDADMMNYQNTLMGLRQFQESLPVNQQQYFMPAIQYLCKGSG